MMSPERIVDVRPTTPAATREHLSEYGTDPRKSTSIWIPPGRQRDHDE